MKLYENLYVFEGLGGCGKSTLGKYISNKGKDIIFVKEIPYFFENEYKQLNNGQSLERSVWFLEKDMERENFIRNLLLKNDEIIILMERNHISTLSYSLTVDECFNMDEFESLFSLFIKEKDRFISPSYYFIFQITPEESLKRQKKRNLYNWPWTDHCFMDNYINNVEYLIKEVEPSKIIKIKNFDFEKTTSKLIKFFNL